MHNVSSEALDTSQYSLENILVTFPTIVHSGILTQEKNMKSSRVTEAAYTVFILFFLGSYTVFLCNLASGLVCASHFVLAIEGDSSENYCSTRRGGK